MGVKEVPGQSGSDWNSSGTSWDRMERRSLATEPQAEAAMGDGHAMPRFRTQHRGPRASAHFSQSWASAASDCCGRGLQVPWTVSRLPREGPVEAIAARQLPALTDVRVLQILGPEVPLRARIRAASRATEARRVAARRRAELSPAAAEVGQGPSGSRRGRDSRRGGHGGWVPSSPSAPALPSSVLQPIRRPP